MNQTVLSRLAKVFSLVAVTGVVLLGGHRAEAADFWDPMIQGYRLDVCRVWGNECGKPAADAFCQRKGFDRATSFTVAHDIGAQSPTRVISSGQICNQAFCDGFRKITCGGNTASKFIAPTIQGYRLDWCREWASDCGRPAANAFCAMKGFSQATAFTPAQDIGAATPTKVIGTGQICNQAFCDGFQSITCR